MVSVVVAWRVRVVQVGVVEHAADLRECQPVGGLADQPGRDPPTAVTLADVQVADIGPAGVAREPLRLRADFLR